MILPPTPDPLAGLQPADVDELVDVLRQFHQRRIRARVGFTLPTATHPWNPMNRRPEREPAFTDSAARAPYWQTFEAFEADIRTLAAQLETTGRTAVVRAVFPIGRRV